MKRKSLAGRYFLLDEIRGFAVICMVFFHAFYTCFETLSIGFFGDLINFCLPNPFSPQDLSSFRECAEIFRKTHGSERSYLSALPPPFREQRGL